MTITIAVTKHWTHAPSASGLMAIQKAGRPSDEMLVYLKILNLYNYTDQVVILFSQYLTKILCCHSIIIAVQLNFSGKVECKADNRNE